MAPQLITKANDLLVTAFFFLLMLAAGFITQPAAASCDYYIYVQTGDRKDAGTDAVVSLVISNRAGTSSSLTIPNLEREGTMGAGYDYFEKGHVDSFHVVADCLPGPPCWMMLSHDNSGNKPGWYVDYVLVITSSSQHLFRVNQWLARDESPYQLATVRNDCGGRRCGGDSNSMTSTSLQINKAADLAPITTTDHGDDAAVSSSRSEEEEHQYYIKPAAAL